jgi:hypothetical protein
VAIKLGLECKLYRDNSGTWEEIGNVRDLTINMEMGVADVTTRGGNGWRQNVSTLRDGTVTFQMVYDTTDADFTALQTAFMASTAAAREIKIAAMDGDIATSGSQGLVAFMNVTNFSEPQNLEEAVMVDVTLQPSYNATAPAWTTIS